MAEDNTNQTENPTQKCKQCQTDIPAGAKRCPQCQKDLRSWPKRHPIMTGIGIIVVILVALAALGSNTQNAQQSNTADATNTQASTGASTDNSSEDQKEYQKVMTFSGNGSKNSKPFTIEGERFKIEYSCQGQICQAWLERPDSDLPQEMIVNSTDSVEDETIIYKSGEFYIKSNTAGTYTFTVYDYK